MSDVTPGSADRWAVGDAYEAYMGRWSRLVARAFLGWLEAEPAGHWLEVGCGTGALTTSVCELCAPASLVACDQSASFVEHVRTNLRDSRVSYVAASVDALPSRTDGFDMIVSGLVLNFLPAPHAALSAMRDRVRSGGVVAAYLWDYAAVGVDLLRYFWEEAVASDASAAALDESQRFATWQRSFVTSLFEGAGLVGVESATLTVPTTFATFDDYWRPFLGGTGPAPSYVASLAERERDVLAKRLRARLPSGVDGAIHLQARGLAFRGARE